MSRLYKEFKTSEEEANWFLKVNDLIYGPITLSTLCDWAAQGRITAENQVSSNRKDWVAAETVPDLKMEWTVELKDGKTYGPFPLLSAPNLVSRGILETSAILSNRTTGKKLSVESLLKPKGQRRPPRQEPLRPKPQDAEQPPKAGSIHAARPSRTEKTEIPKESDLSQLVSELSGDAQARSRALQAIKEQLEKQKAEYQTLKKESREKEDRLNKRIEQLQKEGVAPTTETPRVGAEEGIQDSQDIKWYEIKTDKAETPKELRVQISCLEQSAQESTENIKKLTSDLDREKKKYTATIQRDALKEDELSQLSARLSEDISKKARATNWSAF